LWLIIAPSTDTSALWAFDGLKAAGLAPLEFVSAEALGSARYWEHRLGTGGVSVKFVLEDGRTFCNSRVRGVLNRLVSAPLESVACAARCDRDYAVHETLALYLSWMHSLPGPLLNRPTPQGLCGRWRHSSEWVWLAGRAGLRVETYRQRGSDPVDLGYKSLAPCNKPVLSAIVCGRQVFGAQFPPDVQAGCIRLAELSETDLLGIEFYSGPRHAWTFAHATPLPDLRIGGWALIQCFARGLRNGTPEQEVATA
jgi:hypothetical protein